MKKGEDILKPPVRFKNLLPVIVILVFMGVLFAACGGSGDEGPTEEEQRIEEQFQGKFRLAQQAFRKGKYDEALGRLKQAEKIKKTPQSAKFAKTLAAKMAEKKDDDAYKKAVESGTSTAMADYLKQYPSGRHIKEAEEKLSQLQIEEKKREAERKRRIAASTKLRSQYKTLTRDEVKTMLNARGFFEKYYNKNGDFKNQYELQIIDKEEEESIVHDYATALVWYQSGSPYYMNFEKAGQWLAELNEKKFAGFSHWRMPTLEEAASLVEATENKDGLFIDPIFSREQRYIWTGDTYEKNKYWVIDFFGGDMSRADVSQNVYLRPVCKMK